MKVNQFNYAALLPENVANGFSELKSKTKIL